VIGISFIESWLKFRAPGVTLSVGLGIGRIVFTALNKVEWVLIVIIIGSMLVSKRSVISPQIFMLCLPVIVLLIQTFWLLPALDARAQVVIDNRNAVPSNLHFYFIGGEMVKVCSLVLSGLIFLIKA
jgi:hypothetical protein